MAKQFRSILNYQPLKEQTLSSKSMTIPDQCLSMRQIMERHVRGVPVPGGQQPVYLGEEHVLEGIHPAKLDLADRQKFQENAEYEREYIVNNLNKTGEEKRKKKSEDETEYQKMKTRLDELEKGKS